MSDLVGTQIVVFLTHRLNGPYIRTLEQNLLRHKKCEKNWREAERNEKAISNVIFPLIAVLFLLREVKGIPVVTKID